MLSLYGADIRLSRCRRPLRCSAWDGLIITRRYANVNRARSKMMYNISSWFLCGLHNGALCDYIVYYPAKEVLTCLQIRASVMPKIDQRGRDTRQRRTGDTRSESGRTAETDSRRSSWKMQPSAQAKASTPGSLTPSMTRFERFNYLYCIYTEIPGTSCTWYFNYYIII